MSDPCRSVARMNDNVLAAAARGRDFLVRNGHRLEAAVVDHVWFEGEAHAVVDALASYQNEDGGFGNGLERDIGAPQSNPFATWMALIYLRSIPLKTSGAMRERVAVWLADNQANDGDWHFSAATRSGRLAPWFSEWRFPSLNPACCLAGQSYALGIATPKLLARVHTLFAAQASVDAVREGQFYDVVPYAEYSLTGSLPMEYLDAVAETIVTWAHEDRFDDAEHFFNLALRNSPELAARIPRAVIETYATRALAEQHDDGGWPSPYDPAWRPAATAGVLLGLARANPRP